MTNANFLIKTKTPCWLAAISPVWCYELCWCCWRNFHHRDGHTADVSPQLAERGQQILRMPGLWGIGGGLLAGLCEWMVISKCFGPGLWCCAMNGDGRDPFLIVPLLVAVSVCVGVDGFVSESIAPLYGRMYVRSGARPAVEWPAAVLLWRCKALGPAGCLGPRGARGTGRRMDSLREPGPGRTAAWVAPHLHAASEPPTPRGWGQPVA